MKVFKFLVAGVVAGTMLASCGGSQPPIESVTKAELDSVSYAVGVSLARMISDASLEGLNYAEVKKAMVEVSKGEKTYIDAYQANEIINNYLQKVQMAMGAQREKEEAEFMAQNKTKEGVQETASGLQYKIENPGNELRATAKDTVEVNYKGTLLDGKVFDSSYERGETVKFPLNRVIPGWTEGMQLVGEGGKITLWVPFSLGYGSQAVSADLPAYSTLVFEVELIKISKAQEKKKK
ncbi:MAG: FKBP-type peptidyl-prolyl cis-trans isomerase [Bacteroidales bacterium]|nr:FKBP-type peptidyl-prolyl cis-trans isomerase [Bacteroidales bacterium]